MKPVTLITFKKSRQWSAPHRAASLSALPPEPHTVKSCHSLSISRFNSFTYSTSFWVSTIREAFDQAEPSLEVWMGKHCKDLQGTKGAQDQSLIQTQEGKGCQRKFPGRHGIYTETTG